MRETLPCPSVSFAVTVTVALELLDSASSRANASITHQMFNSEIESVISFHTSKGAHLSPIERHHRWYCAYKCSRLGTLLWRYVVVLPHRGISPMRPERWNSRPKLSRAPAHASSYQLKRSHTFSAAAAR